ncbi:MAG: hypothetical protein H6767_05205 [Candidatus Peribacteria bacterium]|nr:MAG: hypothetical protein H6767_05205 [Candidatus Peribacteria bacterium]
MTNITTTTFEMDNSIIAPCIYGNRQRFTTNEGVEVSAKLQLELQQFLEQYIAFV